MEEPEEPEEPRPALLSPAPGPGLTSGRLGQHPRTPRHVLTHQVEAIEAKLDGEAADEEEEEHDQGPLELRPQGVVALAHEGEV